MNKTELFAEHLFSLAKEDSVQQQLLDDLAEATKILSGMPEYITLLNSPALRLEQRIELIDQAWAGKVHPYVQNLLYLLAQERSMELLPGCSAAYQALYEADRAPQKVIVTTARPLSEKAEEQIREILSGKINKELELHKITDPSCLGGIILEYDGFRLDASVRKRLSNIEKAIKEGTK